MNDLVGSNQPKISVTNGTVGNIQARPNGYIDHSTKLLTFGQASDMVSWSGVVAFDDSKTGIEGTNNQTGFSRMVDFVVNNGLIVDGLVDASTIYPIYLNGGPNMDEETIVEPLTIPMRLLATNENPRFLVHAVYATFEDGSPDTDYADRLFGNKPISQAMQRQSLPTTVRPFLESEGQTEWIPALGRMMTVTPGAVPDPTVVTKIQPWIDEHPNAWVFRLQTSTVAAAGVDDLDRFKLLLSSSLSIGVHGEGTSTVPQTRDEFSASAGFIVGFNRQSGNLTGTDSVAFSGLCRGN